MRSAVKKTGFTPLEKLFKSRRLPKGNLSLTGFTLVELLVVTGIFTLIIGVSFTLLSTGRVSMFVNEAQIEAEENARIATNRISRELRLSRAGHVLISNNPGFIGAEISPESIINFQIPVETPGGALNLNPDGSIRWGSKDADGGYTLNAYIAYYMNGTQLERITYANLDGSGIIGNSIVVATHITAITFSRNAPSSNLVNIELTTQGEANTRTVAHTLRSSIKLRN